GWTLRLTRPDEPYPTGTIAWQSRLGQKHIEIPEPLPGEPDHTNRDHIRQQEWQQELQRISPHIQPKSTIPEHYWGEPPF
ncbi:hypothetical protein, partial [Kineosporia sp. NBRC 101731]|uniref:hypothetical protein n=1 Tax=Kineosporia sp. NBRC 101731 TaxID=3032199 RepID=UPI002554656E